MTGSTHIPVRTCMACRKKAPKSEMTRVVLQSGEPIIDAKHKISARGAYTCSDDCYNSIKGSLANRLSRKK